MIWIRLGIVLLLVLTAAGWFLFPAKPLLNEPSAHNQSSINGTVLEYGSNPDGDIDKLLLGTNEEKRWLHFPPHAARSIKASAPVGSLVEATVEKDRGGAHHHHPDLVFELKYLEGPSGKASVDLTNIPAPPPRKGFEVEVKGNTLKDLTIGPGPAKNFTLSGKIISVPPHKADELLPLIMQAKMILVKGTMRDSTEGFLSASGMPVVKANAIQLDNITYKIR